MDGLVNVLTDDEDMVELINIVTNRRGKKKFRQRENHFEKWSDAEFIKRFRLSKHGVQLILENIRNEISHPTHRNNAVSAEIMVFVALRFYATGSFLKVAADFVGIDTATTCRIVHKVSRAIAALHKTYIKMPNTLEDMKGNSAQFYKIARFPKCIGAVDCTHIKISSPGGDQAEIYRNRKNFFSLNVQVICDASLRIQNIVCRWPGSAHDSTIFCNSTVRAKFEQYQFKNYVLVGDSGYGIRQFLITPLANPVSRAEQLFNESQIRTRNPVERCFGVWKRRFPILALGIRIKLQNIEAVVVATAVLHNIACMLKEDMPPTATDEAAAIDYVNNVHVNPARNILGGLNNAIRHQLINDYYSRL